MSETPNPFVEKFAELEGDAAILDKEVLNQIRVIDNMFNRPTLGDLVQISEAVELHKDELKKVEKPKDSFGREIPKRGIDEYGDMKWRHIAAGVDDAGLKHRRDNVNTIRDRQEVEATLKRSVTGNKDSITSFGYWVLHSHFDNPEDIPIDVFKAFVQFGAYLKNKALYEQEAGRPLPFGLPNKFRDQPLDFDYFKGSRPESPVEQLKTRYKASRVYQTAGRVV